MLVLSRKAGEEIVIGEEVIVSVLRINGSRVSIGITGPRGVTVLRGELVAHEAIEDQEAVPCSS